MTERGLSIYQVSILTGVPKACVRLIMRNQRLPNLVQAARFEAHLGIPHESWLGTHLGKVSWEASTPRPDEMRKQNAATWLKWAYKSGKLGKPKRTPAAVTAMASHLTVGTDEEKLAFAKKMLEPNGQ